jgi:hypothetical protein
MAPIPHWRDVVFRVRSLECMSQALQHQLPSCRHTHLITCMHESIEELWRVVESHEHSHQAYEIMLGRSHGPR